MENKKDSAITKENQPENDKVSFSRDIRDVKEQSSNRLALQIIYSNIFFQISLLSFQAYICFKRLSALFCLSCSLVAVQKRVFQEIVVIHVIKNV